MNGFSRSSTDVVGFWCTQCERVTFHEGEDKPYRCGYEDCERNNGGGRSAIAVALLGPDYKWALANGYSVIQRIGGAWTELRPTYHPEYPLTPEAGINYPLPELKSDPTLVVKQGAEWVKADLEALERLAEHQ